MIVRDINDIKIFTPVNVSLEYTRIEPILYETEQKVANVIGTELYIQLDLYLDNPTPIDPKKDTVIKLLKACIAWMMFDIGFDILNTQFSNQGFHRLENEQQGKKALFQRQEMSLRRTFRDGGNNRLDQVLTYLEVNAADFPIWTASSAYTQLRDNYIWTTAQFQSIINISNSRLVFQRLKQNMMTVAELYIAPLIGNDFHVQLLTEIATNSLTADNLKLVAYLQKAVAFQTITDAGSEFIMSMSEAGLHILGTATNTDNSATAELPPMELINDFLRRAKLNAESYLRTTQSFLRLNLDKYPLYATSPAYTETVYNTFKNDGKIFIV